MRKIICIMLVVGFLATAIAIPNIFAKSSILEDRNELLIEKKSNPSEPGFIFFAEVHTSEDFESTALARPLIPLAISPGVYSIHRIFIKEITKGTLYMNTLSQGTIELKAGDSFSPSSFGGRISGEKNFFIWTITSVSGFGIFINY